MSGPLSGIRVLEVAAWTFVPAAGAVLAEWGADVIKIEHPVGGDPQRGLITSGLVPAGKGGVNYMIEVPNRGKRSIGLNLASAEGREILLKLAAQCDVFLTSFLPSVRTKLGIDLEDIRAVNPGIIYARGSGYGPKGEENDRPGYDGVSYWARGGVGEALTQPGDWPVGSRPAFGDIMGGLTIAGGIAAAIAKRERTGETSEIDVSLLGLALWNLSPDVTSSKLYEGIEVPSFDRKSFPNPLVGTYKTSDDRYICLMMLQPDRFWAEVVTLLGRADLIEDERFKDNVQRFMNRTELIEIFYEIFGSKTQAEWMEALKPLSGAWGPLQRPIELHDDPAVMANGYMAQVTSQAGATFGMPMNPVQFDGVAVVAEGAPEHGQHTEDILLEVGFDWDDIAKLKDQGDVL